MDKIIYKTGEEANIHDLVAFKENPATKLEFDALGIVVSLTSPRNVGVIARFDHVWNQVSEQISAVNLSGAVLLPSPRVSSNPEIESCTREQFRHSRALPVGICERCGNPAVSHPWGKAEPASAPDGVVKPAAEPPAPPA